MANPIYREGPRRGPLRKPTGNPYTTDLLLQDDGDNPYWTNSQYGFSNVSSLIAVAALGIAVATLNSFNYQDEVEAKVVGESSLQQVIPIGEESRGFLFQSDEEIFPQTTIVLDTGDWLPSNPIVPSPIAFTPTHQDENFLVAVEEPYSWEAKWNQVYPNTNVANSNEEIVPQPVGFIPEEDYWYQLKSDIVSIQIVNWPESGIADGSGPSLITIEESNWGVWTPPLIDPKVYWQIDGDIIVPQPPSSISVVESEWAVYTPPLIAAKLLYLPDPDEIPAGSLVSTNYPEVSDYGFNQRADAITTVMWWPLSDEFIPQTPLNIMEVDWQVYTPPLQIAQPIYLPDTEQVPGILTAPPIIEEEDWKVWTPPLVVAKGLYQPDTVNDSIIPQPLPLPFDEEPWQVWFPALVAANQIYLPDPEQIPAGLVPPPVPKGKSRYWRERRGVNWTKPFSFTERIEPVIESIDVQIKEQKQYKEKLVLVDPKTDFSSIEKEIINVERKIKVLQEEKQEYYRDYSEYAKKYLKEQAEARKIKRDYIASFPEGLEALELEELIRLGVFDD